MSIIFNDSGIRAQVTLEGGALNIRFDDPAYIRAEQVIVDPDSGELGIVFEQGFHTLGQMPAGTDLTRPTVAFLTGVHHDLRLRAPVKISSH